MAVVKKCQLCGGVFTTRHNSQQYCCKSCANTAKADRNYDARKASVFKLTCAMCEKPFTNIRKRTYCSTECRLQANGRGGRLKPKDKKAEKPNMTIAEVCVAARQQGMTYGQYVAKFGS